VVGHLLLLYRIEGEREMSSFTSFSETTLALQKSRLHPLSAFASCLPMAGQEGLAA
jgi:hypothetical protein